MKPDSQGDLLGCRKKPKTTNEEQVLRKSKRLAPQTLMPSLHSILMLLLLMARLGLANYLATSSPWWLHANSLGNRLKPRPAEKDDDKYKKPEWRSLPQLGDLYDCSKLGPTEIHTSSPRDDCGIISETKHFKAPVYEYQVETKVIKMYHCRAEQHKLICNSNFFNAHDRDDIIKKQFVSPAACQMAVKYKNTMVGKLEPLGEGLWGTKNKLAYDCAWDEDLATLVKEFYVETYEAVISAENNLLTQTITQTQCTYETGKAGFCVPLELPNSVLIYDPPSQMQPLYRFKGMYDIYSTHHVYTIPGLSTGGALLRETADYLLLDTSYLITLTNKKLDNMQQINQTLMLERKLTTGLSFDHYTSEMGREIMILNSRIQSLERVLCQQMKSLGFIENGISVLYPNA